MLPVSCCILTLIVLCASAGDEGKTESVPPAAKGQEQKPYLDFRQRATPYAGPGRDVEEPAGVNEVLIGYFGPSDPDDPAGGDLWHAAEWAIHEANTQGGYHGKPFRLVPAWSENPWKAGISRLARMVYQEKVWAILGGIDGTSAHLAEQVVAKARLPLISPASGDRSANVANVPWMFSILPGDHLQAPVLVDVLAHKPAFAEISTDEHDAHRFVVELDHALNEKHQTAHFRHVIADVDRDSPATCRLVVSEGVEAVVVVASPHPCARLRARPAQRGLPRRDPRRAHDGPATVSQRDGTGRRGRTIPSSVRCRTFAPRLPRRF